MIFKYRQKQVNLWRFSFHSMLHSIVRSLVTRWTSMSYAKQEDHRNIVLCDVAAGFKRAWMWRERWPSWQVRNSINRELDGKSANVSLLLQTQKSTETFPLRLVEKRTLPHKLCWLSIIIFFNIYVCSLSRYLSVFIICLCLFTTYLSMIITYVS